MTAKSQIRISPELLSNQQFSGTIAAWLYNWPIFSGLLLFGVVLLCAGSLIHSAWAILVWGPGLLALLFVLGVTLASFVVYDWGREREYHRLVTLGQVADVNVVIDITAGKLRGTRGLLAATHSNHYFVVDIFDAEKMPDAALRRAREMEPPLEVGRRVYRRSGKPNALPIPHNWADVVYCSFSLHELQAEADREVIFKEFSRILKPGGKLLIAEHGRDVPNLLAFGPGVFSFFTPATWQRHLTSANLSLTHHERWRGLVHLWVAEKNRQNPNNQKSR
jgi:ubiquinone/menaquinone biosynthesis C-methylase UbiE